MSTRDVISSADVSAKRYSLFKGNATDDEWGIKIESLRAMSLNDLHNERMKLL
jgi:hypothetical protein